MRRFFFLFLSLFFIFSVSSKALTLKELVEELDSLKPQEIERAIEELPEEDRLKLEVLLLSFAGKDEKAAELLKKIYSLKVISNVLELPPDLKAVVVDKTNEVLYVIGMDRGFPKVIRWFSCITGKRPGDKLEEGDLRTPEGIYFPLYWKGNLPKLYGVGAFPLNYPNLLDKTILKRNGHGIWIHGTDNPDRPPHSTNGCIVLKNEYLKELKKLIVPKRTPVVIVSSLSYSRKEDFLEEKKSLLNFVLRWKRAWENTPKDISAYLNCYSKSFVWKKGGYEDWVKYKKKITGRKRWIRIRLSDLVVTKDGRILSFGNLYVVRMKLDYRSNNYRSITNKVLYVIKEDGEWKILGEENL